MFHPEDCSADSAAAADEQDESEQECPLSASLKQQLSHRTQKKECFEHKGLLLPKRCPKCREVLRQRDEAFGKSVPHPAKPKPAPQKAPPKGWKGVLKYLLGK